MMMRWAFFGLILVTLSFPCLSNAQERGDELRVRGEVQSRDYRSRSEWDTDTEKLPTPAELESTNPDTDQGRMSNEMDESGVRALRGRESYARRSPFRELLFWGVLLLMACPFLGKVLKKYSREEHLNDNERFGILIIVFAFASILLALILSRPWVSRLDFFENVMDNLELRLFKQDKFCSYEACEYLIEIQTKYIVLALLGIATYGLTTFLGLTHPFSIRSPIVTPQKKND